MLGTGALGINMLQLFHKKMDELDSFTEQHIRGLLPQAEYIGELSKGGLILVN